MGFWSRLVICAKSSFLYILDVPIKMFVLNQQAHVHFFQTQLMEIFYISIFVVGVRRGTR